MDQIKKLVGVGYQTDSKSYPIMIINDQLDILKFFIEMGAPISDELLMYCVEFNRESIYFYLRGVGAVPNISVYNRAILGNSLLIITDINNQIGISAKTLEQAFETNNTDIILFLIQEAITSNVNIDSNLIAYPILNKNFDLLNELNKYQIINWHYELYYSALLSGSMEMILFIESKIPNIHDDHILDTSRTQKGRQTSLLLHDMIYQRSNKKYFSHTINYAIQSGSIEIVQWIHSKGYGITVSNIITSIRSGQPQIFEFIINSYANVIPFYILHYFSMWAYVPNKMIMAKILIDSKLFEFDPIMKISMDTYRKESIHLAMINDMAHSFENIQVDIDYLMSYKSFFVETNGYKLNNKLLIKMRICLELNLDGDLLKIFSASHNDSDNRSIIDSLYLFGTFDQICHFHPLINKCPSDIIIGEIICYRQINKLCYLIKNNLLTEQCIDFIHSVIITLDDPSLNMLIPTLTNKEPDIKNILLSGNKLLIDKWITEHQNDKHDYMTNDIIKILLLTEDLELINKFDIRGDSLIEWAYNEDLLEVCSHLKK